MKKLRVGIIFGGKSGEHEVSIVSATNVSKALDPAKYEVTLIGIDKTGRWVLTDPGLLLQNSTNPRLVKLAKEMNSVSLVPYESKTALLPVESKGGVPAIGGFDVLIPILHGTYGEDGTIQGLIELANIPYVGSGVLGSSVGMDKDVARRLMKEAGIPVVPTRVIRRHQFQKNPEAMRDLVIKELGLPFFVKPANAGSSVGVHKVKTKEEALEKMKDSFAYDIKILAEKSIPARELECAVLGLHEPKASVVGEIIPHHEFYSYEAKYIDENGASLKIPAENVSAETIKKIQEYSVQVFQVLELRGMARVDFFVDKSNGDLYLNEVNTIPGFTQISMYPKLWGASGIGYSELIDHLIQFAIEAHTEKTGLKTSFDVNEK